MTDIRLDTEFLRHPKTKKLRRQLGSDSVLSLLTLWSWAATNRPNGDLAGLDNEDIELAAEWGGEAGLFADALTRLHWLDGEPGQYHLHGWAEHNTWAAGAGNRNDTRRMNVLKRYNPKLYEELKAKGVTRLSKAQYGELVTGQKSFAEIEAEFEAMARAEQEPEAAEADEAIGAILADALEPEARQTAHPQTQAANALVMFPTRYKLSFPTAVAWVARMETRYPDIDLAEAINEAADYVRDKEIRVGSSRAFLESLFAKLYDRG